MPPSGSGRPPISKDLGDPIVQPVEENTRWDYGKIAGELQTSKGFGTRPQLVLERVPLD